MGEGGECHDQLPALPDGMVLWVLHQRFQPLAPPLQHQPGLVPLVTQGGALKAQHPIQHLLQIHLFRQLHCVLEVCPHEVQPAVQVLHLTPFRTQAGQGRMGHSLQGCLARNEVSIPGIATGFI